MKKTVSLFAVFLLSLALCSQAWAKPAQKGNITVMVLPFQVNAPGGGGTLGKDLPELFVQRLTAQGFKVLPYAQTRNLIKSQNVGTLNVETARQLANSMRASYAVYGSLNQSGKAFSLDVRMVPAGGTGPARPYFVERKDLVELAPAVADIATRISNDAVQKNTLGAVQVRGLKVLDPDVVLMRLSTSKGDTVDPATLNAEIKRVWDIGYFSDVTAEIENTAEGPTLVITVVEKPRISDVIVNGSDSVRKDDILAAMSSKTGSVVNERLLAQDIQKVTDLYRKEGYYLADVKYRIEERAGTASAALVFDVTEGKKLYIKKIELKGLETINEGDLKKELALGERSLISFITGTGVLREEYLERDSAALQAYCMNNGYVDARIAAPEVVYEEDGIVISFTVDEGVRHRVGEIAFAGDLIDTPERLLEVVLLDDHKKDQEFFALDIMQNDIARLTDLYTNYGYAFAEVDVDTVKTSEGDTINVTYIFNKKNKVYVRRVNTQGNTRTRDNVILREMRLGDGDAFDGSKLRRSNERLHRLRYFSEVDTVIVPTDNPDEVDLNVSVKEDRTGSIMAGVGYSTYYKIGISGSVEERNLFGKGYSLSLRGYFSGRSSSLDMSFINPRLYDTDIGFGNDTYILREEWDDFEKKTVGNTFRFFYPLGEYTTMTLGYRLDRYNLMDVPESAPRSYKEYEGQNLSSVVNARVVYDSTDSIERPTKGYIFRLGAEYGGGGIGGNDNFFKPMIEMQGFHMLYNKDHIFHWRTRGGMVLENSNKPVPVFDRFFIGGIDSIRGYDSEDLTPKDAFYGDEIGGDRMAFLNLEYIWTFHKEMGLALVPFFDIGFQTDSKQTDNPFSELKKSVGLELRWRSPMGDLRFAYGYPLDRSVSGKKLPGRFEFSMGQAF